MNNLEPRMVNETIITPGMEPPVEPEQPTGAAGDLTDELLHADFWSDDLVARAGIPVVDVPLVSVGGGMGSFVLCDWLRIAGVPTSEIKVLSATETPWETYQYLASSSQVPEHERLRSDSVSCPDNIWGYPSYAFREAFGERSLSKIIAPLWNVFTEPIFTDYFTPRSGQVFKGVRREADRIGWWSMVEHGQVRMVRKRDRGGYFTILTPPSGTTPTKRVAYRSNWVQIAVGYPGLRYLPDLQEYRQRHRDYAHVVNAYEPHTHIYEELLLRPGTVVVRGSGIVASRILQRLIDDRDHHGAQTTINHLFRHYIREPHGPNIWMRRPGGNGWAYQGFNWPKGSWGGQLKFRLERSEGEDRKHLLEIMGGTTTPKRKLWRHQLARGKREGWYREYIGEVTSVEPGPHDTVVTKINTSGGVLELPASFIIDATGLEADIKQHRVLADLLEHSGAGRNPLGKLDVERNFEIRGARSGTSKMYAVGSSTLGGYYAVVDSFLGLSYSGLQIADDLANQGFCKRIGSWSSVRNWWLWSFHRELPGRR